MQHHGAVLLTGEWLHAGATPSRVWIVYRRSASRSAHHANEPEGGDDEVGYSYFAQYSPAGLIDTINSVVGPFISLAAAREHVESATGKTVRWHE